MISRLPAVIDKNTKEVIIKIVNSSSNERSASLMIEGVKTLRSPASVTVLTGTSLEEENSIDSPEAIKPVVQSTNVKGSEINITVKPNSVTVIRIGMNSK